MVNNDDHDLKRPGQKVAPLLRLLLHIESNKAANISLPALAILVYFSNFVGFF